MIKRNQDIRIGFTLIELLVVIAIIDLLASVAMVSFPGAAKKHGMFKDYKMHIKYSQLFSYIKRMKVDIPEFLRIPVVIVRTKILVGRIHLSRLW